MAVAQAIPVSEVAAMASATRRDQSGVKRAWKNRR